MAKTIFVGSVELTQTEADHLIGMFRGEGWHILCRILENNRRVETENLLAKAEHKTLQETGLAQGVWRTTEAVLCLPEEADQEYELTFSQK